MNVAMRYFNTVRYLKLSQITYQLYRKIVHKRIKWYEYAERNIRICPLYVEKLDNDEEYIKRFRPQRLIYNEICLLNQAYQWEQGQWCNQEASHLWNFNLHYFEYGIALAHFYKRTGDIQYREKLLELIEDWIESVRDGDGWQAYTISLRIPNWLIAFEILEEPIPPQIRHSIFIQYRWLLRNQEKQLLGNHYFENLKTILICSHLFQEENIFNRYIEKLKKEITREILPDGVHFELSLMYHKIILEDIIRIAVLLEYKKNNNLEYLISIIKKMNNALHSLEYGMGKTPHFNDAGDNISKSMAQLCGAIKDKWGIEPRKENVFQYAGYYKLSYKNTEILFDAGPLGPRYMCGHAHCDALSFELSVADEPLLVNAGTYQYQDRRRGFFRSTEAHNTVVIAGEQQSELWGEHRAARRIRKVHGKCGTHQVQGSYFTYKGRHHRRQIRVVDNSEINIIDQIRGPSGKTVSAFFRVAPGLTWKKEGEHEILLFNTIKNQYEMKLSFSKGTAVIHRDEELCAYARNFGELKSSDVLEIRYPIQDGLAENKTSLFVYT